MISNGSLLPVTTEWNYNSNSDGDLKQISRKRRSYIDNRDIETGQHHVPRQEDSPGAVNVR